MSKILNSCVLGLCGTLALACGSSSKRSDSTGSTKMAPATEKPAVVAADPIEAHTSELARLERRGDEPSDAIERGAYGNEPGMPPEGERTSPTSLSQDGASAVATATLADSKGKEVGQVRFEQQGRWVTMSGEFSGLPSGKRGFQMRTNGDCGGKGASRSGGDFNPTKSKHGPPEAAVRHVGDFGNITVGDDGTARIEMKTDAMTVTEGVTSIVGRSIVVTSRADDGKSQPSGNAGPAIACGVIRAEAD